jgi:hypothetical protein
MKLKKNILKPVAGRQINPKAIGMFTGTNAHMRKGFGRILFVSWLIEDFTAYWESHKS